MRRWLFTSTVVLFSLVSAAACSYTAPKAGSQILEDYPFRESQGHLALGVNPFVSEERLKETLSGGEDYLRNKVLPIQILLRNDGPNEQLFRLGSVQLVWIDGSSRVPLNTSETYETVRGSMAAAAIFGGVIGASAMASRMRTK